MSTSKKFIVQVSHYFTGNLLILLGGLISFPILTRIFSKEEYGVMSLVTSTLEIASVICCAGLGSSVIRFYGEHKKSGTVNRLYWTLFLTSFLFGAIGTIFLLYAEKIRLLRFLGKDIVSLLAFCSFLILIKSLSYILKNCLRAEERTIFYNIVQVFERYLSLGLSLFLILALKMGLRGLYTGIITGEGATMLLLLVAFFFRYRDNFKISLSGSILVSSLCYSIPILFQNFSGFVANSGDRYLIQYFLGPAEVGIYSVGYTLVSYIQGTFVMAVNSTVVPATMNLWASEGKEETRQFLQRIIQYYWGLAFPIIFGVCVVGKDMLNIVASSKYGEASVILPYVITGLMITGGYFPFFAGLYLYKKTYIVAISLFVSASINMALNVILIPHYGIAGAAVATLVSYIFYVAFGALFAYRSLTVPVPWRKLGLYFFSSVIMYLIIDRIDLGFSHKFLALGVKVLVGSAAYGLLVVLFDEQIRRHILRALLLFKEGVFSQK